MQEIKLKVLRRSDRARTVFENPGDTMTTMLTDAVVCSTLQVLVDEPLKIVFPVRP